MTDKDLIYELEKELSIARMAIIYYAQIQKEFHPNPITQDQMDGALRSLEENGAAWIKSVDDAIEAKLKSGWASEMARRRSMAPGISDDILERMFDWIWDEYEPGKFRPTRKLDGP